jgi:hypothetical protein
MSRFMRMGIDAIIAIRSQIRTPIAPRCGLIVLFVAATAGAHARAQDEDRLDVVPAELQAARFRAAYSIRPAKARRLGSDLSVAFGDFTIQGPIQSTLRPIPSVQPHAVSASDGIYVGDWRVDERGKSIDWLKGVTGRAPGRIETVAAFDAKRKHLICLDRRGYWYRFDIERRRFVDRHRYDGRATCLVYDSDRDAVLGIGPSDGGGQRLDVYSVEGQHRESIDLSAALGEPPAVHVVMHRGYLLVISPATFAIGKPMTPGRIEAINARNGELVYRGALRPLDDDGKPLDWSIAAADRTDELADEPKDDTPLHERWRKRLDAQAATFPKDDRDDLAERIDELREYAQGDTPKRRGGTLRIHALHLSRSTNDGDPVFLATVRVTDGGRPMALFLSAYGPTQWRLDVDANAQLTQVYITGFGPSAGAVEGLPATTRLTYWRYGDSRIPFLSSDTPESFWANARAAFGIQSMTALIVKGETDTIPNEIEIGPGNLQWKRQYLASLSRDIETRFDAARLASRTFLAAAPLAERSAGVYRALDDSSMMTADLVGSRYGEFTLRGPSAKVVASPNVRAALVADGGPGHRYVADLHQVFHVDDASGKLAPLGRAGIEPEPSSSWPRLPGNICGIAYDAKRKELVAAFNYEWNPTLYRWKAQAGRWEMLARIGTTSTGLAYDARHDLFYSLGDLSTCYHRRHYVEVVAFTRLGATVAVSELTVPVAQAYFAGPPQLILVDDRLVVITPTHERFGEPRVSAAETYIVDPRSGKSHFVGAFRAAR